MNEMSMKKRKQGGFVLTAELVLIVTILVLGMIVGLVTMRDSMTAEMEDVAEAIGSLDQGYQYDGIVNAEETAAIAGSVFSDDIDSNAGDGEGFSFVETDGTEETIGDGFPGADAAENSGTVLGGIQ